MGIQRLDYVTDVESDESVFNNAASTIDVMSRLATAQPTHSCYITVIL